MSEFDYYQVLQLNRTATIEDIQKAFRKLSLKYHPTKNPSNITVCSDQFHQICEAYEVLSDFKARTVYDSYGSEQLSRGLHRIKGTSYPGYKYKQNAFEIFEKFYHEYLPYNEIFDDKGKDLYGSCFGYAFGGILNQNKIIIDTVILELKVTLEELYNGCIKEINSENSCVLDEHEEHKVGHTEPIYTYTKSSTSLESALGDREEPIRVEIKPGYSDGYVITVKNDSSSTLGPKGDIFVHLKQVKHQCYTRKSDSLILKYDIKLIDCLNVTPIQFKTLDGRILNISLDHIVSPQSMSIVENEGMPIYDKDEEIANVV